ncbi:MAG: hypothetical protein LBJ94_01250 [Puniceicoccales bacterium]|nr:hypothetical protein [Puniceicoccales bacterium]
MWNKMEVMPTEDFGKKQGQSPYEIDCLQYFKAKASTDPAVDGGERTKSSKNSSQSSEKEPGEPVAEAKDKYAFIQLSSQEDYDYDDEDDEDDDIEEEDDEEGDDESDDDIEAKLLANRILRNERPKPEEYKLTKAAYEELSRRGAPLSPPAGLKTAKGEGETGKQMDVSAMLEDVVDREVAAYESGGKKVEAELSAV